MQMYGESVINYDQAVNLIKSAFPTMGEENITKMLQK